MVCVGDSAVQCMQDSRQVSEVAPQATTTQSSQTRHNVSKPQVSSLKGRVEGRSRLAGRSACREEFLLQYHVNELWIMLVLINVITLGTLWCKGKTLSAVEILVPVEP